MRRLYDAVCTWLEAGAQAKGFEHEPIPEGNNFTNTELDGRMEPAELHQQHRPPAEYTMGFTNNRKDHP